MNPSSVVSQAHRHGVVRPIRGEKVFEDSFWLLLQVAFRITHGKVSHKRKGMFDAQIELDRWFINLSGAEPFRILDVHELESSNGK